MQIVDYPADAAHVKIDESICAYTKPHEVRALLWLASKHPGAIVEIGANSGRTTSQLANHFRYRTIYAIDRLQTEGMAREQVAEVPSPSDFCAFANALPNVLPIIQDGAALRYDLLSDVGFVFIDGDHSYKGVR